MLRTNRFETLFSLDKALAVLLCAALVIAECPRRGESHGKVRIATRPAALYTAHLTALPVKRDGQQPGPAMRCRLVTLRQLLRNERY